MKIAGYILIVIGIIGILFAFTMNVTATVPPKDYGSGIKTEETKVNNVGLMDNRRNYLILSGIIVLSGVMLVGFGGILEIIDISNKNSEYLTIHTKISESDNIQKCSFCGAVSELDQNDIINKKFICQNCNKENTVSDEILRKKESSEIKNL